MKKIISGIWKINIYLVLFVSNVVLDVLLDRAPFSEHPFCWPSAIGCGSIRAGARFKVLSVKKLRLV